MQADREGRKIELAEKFECSLVYQDSKMLVEAEIMNTEGADSEMLKELGTKRATSTSFLFALKTILKVKRACLQVKLPACRDSQNSHMIASWVGT